MPFRISKNILILGAILLCLFLGLFIALSSHGPLYSSVTSFDYSVDNAVAPLRHHQDLAQFMLSMTYLGNPEIIIVFEICLLAIIIIVHRKRIAALFLGGIVLGEVISLFFKNILARARPIETLFHVSRVGYSFPSGHALLSMIFYGCLGFFAAHVARKTWQKKLIGIVVGCIIFLIGFSRVFLGVHWFSDVIAGWSLGGVCLVAIIAVFQAIHHHLKNENRKLISAREKIWIIIIALMLGFFITFFFVTHLSELRSIV